MGCPLLPPVPSWGPASANSLFSLSVALPALSASSSVGLSCPRPRAASTVMQSTTLPPAAEAAFSPLAWQHPFGSSRPGDTLSCLVNVAVWRVLSGHAACRYATNKKNRIYTEPHLVVAGPTHTLHRSEPYIDVTLHPHIDAESIFVSKPGLYRVVISDCSVE